MKASKVLTFGTMAALSVVTIELASENKIKDEIIDIQRKEITRLRNNVGKPSRSFEIDSLCKEAYNKGIQSVRDSIKSVQKIK